MQTNGLNIALIGCGFFVVQLASAFDKAQANLIAVTDINPSLAQKLADQYGSQAFFSVEEMLAETKPDLVVIATPNYAHYSPAILALNSGCHVFIETPFTLSSSQGQHLRRLAEEKGKFIFVGHLERTLPGMLKVKAALEQGKLGRITVARAMRQRWIENLPNKEWWKLDANLTGGELFHQLLPGEGAGGQQLHRLLPHLGGAGGLSQGGQLRPAQLLSGAQAEGHHLTLPQAEDGSVLQVAEPAALHPAGGGQLTNPHPRSPRRRYPPRGRRRGRRPGPGCS